MLENRELEIHFLPVSVFLSMFDGVELESHFNETKVPDSKKTCNSVITM